MRTLQDYIIDKLIKDGRGWYIVHKRLVNDDLCHDIKLRLTYKLEYILRRKLTIQKKVLDAWLYSTSTYVNVFDKEAPSCVRFIGRFIEIGANFITNSGSQAVIAYERNRLRCKGKREVLHSIFENGMCSREIPSHIRLECAMRCSECNLPYCPDCVLIRRNEMGYFNCSDHT